MSEGQPLLLGIDLGTSQSSVVSNTGIKALIPSVVGCPKDLIGVKLLGVDKIIGDAALERRSCLNLHYPLDEGVLKEGELDMHMALELIREIVKLATTGNETKICGVIGVPSGATESNKDHLRSICNEVLDTTLLVSEPFTVAYGLGILENSIVIDIGAGTTDICAMKGSMPTMKDELSLTKGGKYIDKVLMHNIQQKFPKAKLTPHLCKEIKENHSFVGEPLEHVIVQLRQPSKPIESDVTAEVRLACESIVPDIVENVIRLLQGFDPQDIDTVLSNIWLAGGGSKIQGLDEMLADRLSEYGDIVIRKVNDPIYAGCEGSLKLATELPPEYWDQIGEMIGNKFI